MKLFYLFIALLSFSITSSAQIIYEDFEDGGSLNWNAANGVYNGIVENPDTTGINSSANVGSYTKSGEHSFSLFLAELDDSLDLSVNNIFRIHIWSPAATEVLLKLEGGTDPPIEDRREITEDSTWVELVYDFRAAATRTTLNKIIIFFDPGVTETANTYLFDNLIASPAPDMVIWEDFEGGADLPWNAVNGMFSGVVENPDTTGLNNSLDVGSYTKSGEHAFSQLRVDLDDPIDFYLLNKVSIQVYSPVKTEFILKFEGGGAGIEKRTNIPTANTWREYTFDFSGAADITTLSTILIFFDPGVADSDDTYLFDNLIVMPSDECAGTIPIAGIIDDFECQRNATYDNGWDRLTVVDNPDPTLVNPSTKVGEYSKPAGEPWAALVADYDNAIDLSELNVLRAKVWSPVEGQMLFKLEGGVSPAKEIFIDIPSTDEWVNFSADFSSYAAENHKRVAIFFSAGTEYEDDVTFYIDDIAWGAKESVVLEDFDDTKLVWLPLNGDMEQHGTFEVIENPDPDDVNDSENVGSYTKGNSNFSTLSAILTEPLDFSVFTQLNLQVWAPAGSENATMQLASPTSGNVNADADIEATEQWITLSFDYSTSANISDFGQINLIFDAQSDIDGPYYIDNLTLGETTVDPCEGVVANPRIVDDFECQRNVEITIGAGDLEAVLNPDVSPENPSSQVGQYTEPDGAFAALVYNYGDGNPIDLSVFNQFKMKIWAPRAVARQQVPVLFKLEGGPGAPTEIFMNITEAEQWVEYTVDFSGAAGKGYTRLVLFFNAGQEAVVGEVYYIDDLKWARAPYNGCIADFETEETSVSGWIYFANGTYADSTIVTAENPLKEGINTSDRVAVFNESGPGAAVNIFAGAFAVLETYLEFPDPGNKTVSVDILMDHAARVVFKVERSQTGGPNSGDVFAQYTTPGEWETVTWDFNALPTGGQYTTIVIILDFDNIPDETKTYYFDNIRLGESECGEVTGIYDVTIPSFQIVPNPARGYVELKTPGDFNRLEIFNIYGQKVIAVNQALTNVSQIDISHLVPGFYVATAFDKGGKVIGNGRFIKE